MASVTPFTLLIVVVVLVIIMPYLAAVSEEYSQSAMDTESMNSLSYNLSTSYNQAVLEPLIGNPSNGGKYNQTSSIMGNLNFSRNMQGASSLFGFAFAFILPNMINILIQLMSIPQMIGQCVAVLLTFIPLAPISTTVISAYVTGLGWLFLGLLFLSSWLKYPMV